LLKDKHEQLENDARQAKAQLTELGRTTTDYSNMIKKKDEQISLLTEQLDALKIERDNASMEISQLHADLDTLDSQLAQEKQEHQADNEARRKLQNERDELRTLLATKTSEETRRSEVEKSKEAELTSLRNQCAKLQQELTDSRHSAIEIQNKLKVDLEQVTREYTSLQSSHASLSDRERIAQAQLTRVQGHLAELERAKRSMDSELLSLRARQHDSESQLAEAQRDKTVRGHVLRAHQVWSNSISIGSSTRSY
jgi:myosin protein heavy chain